MRDEASTPLQERPFSPVREPASADEAPPKVFPDTIYPDLGPRSLVALPAGRDGKDNLRRVVERFGHGSFDFLLLVYDDSRYDEVCFTGCTVVYDRSPLFRLLKRHLAPWLCRRYEYVFVWMDDLDVLDFDPQNFLRILRTHRIEVAQPALSDDSVIYHPLTARRNEPIGRYTDFVEEMACVFRGDLWERFWTMIAPDTNPWGWGYDELAYSVCRLHRMAVIDAEVIKHLRRGAYHAEALAPREETLKRYHRFYFPMKRTICPITDKPLPKHFTTPLRLHLYFLFAWLHSLPGIVRLRPYLRACLRSR